MPKKKKLTRRRDGQLAISNKEHVKYEATQTYLPVTYQHDSLRMTANDHSNGVGDHSNNKARHLQPPIFLQRVPSEEKSTKQCDTGTNACHHWFLPWIMSTSTLAWRSLTGGMIFPLVSKIYALFLAHPPPMPYDKSQTKSMLCAIEHRCVCSYSYVPILLTREYKPCRFARPCIIQPSRPPGTQPLAMLLCGFFWRSNRNHY